ncbi:MAG: single-stranded DNA-binding protein [Eubacterium sp.]|nr:single-stranded DNA-binding protein [Eubacterium sp.]
MNKVILMGRLTRDPDVRYSNSQNGEQLAIARYTLAVDRRNVRRNAGDNQQSADFIPCVAFGRTGEFAEKYFRQGTKVAITGRIQTGSYTNKDGQKVYTTEVVVEEQEFAESKGAGSQSQGGYEPQAAPAPEMASAEGFMNIPEGIENDLPFK